MTVAVRAAPEEGPTVKLTDPLPTNAPVPFSPTQATGVAAFHWQPLPVATATATVPPAAPTEWLRGSSVYVHEVCGCPCQIVKPAGRQRRPCLVRPAPAVTVNGTVADPVPSFWPSVTQLALLAAVHGQDGPVVRVMTPAPPAAGAAYESEPSR